MYRDRWTSVTAAHIERASQTRRAVAVFLVQEDALCGPNLYPCGHGKAFSFALLAQKRAQATEAPLLRRICVECHAQREMRQPAGQLRVHIRVDSLVPHKQALGPHSQF
jgi:hypothetical protein